jgi:cytoskeletal protein RodZ
MTPASSPGNSTEMGLGQVLRSARTTRGLSLADLQSRTKVRAKYLSALEDERYEDLPPFPYARGFLLAAAQELGLESDSLVARLSHVMAALPAAQGGERPRLDAGVTPAVRRSRFRRMLTLIGGALIVVGVALVVYFAQQLREFSQPAPPPVAVATPAPAASVTSTPAPTLSAGAASSAQQTPQPATSPTAASSLQATPAPQNPTPRDLTLTGTDGVTLEITLSGASWLRVIGDGRTIFEGIVRDGESRRWQARQTLSIRVGNGGAVSGTVNGQPLGVFGGNGQVVDRTFRLASP